MKALFNGMCAAVFDADKPATRVILFGAIGGALGVVAGYVMGDLTKPWYVLFLPSILLGAGAAFATVFVLLGIKTEDVLRCCGVALLAGFFWRPVFDAGKDYLLNAPERAAEAEVVQTSKELDTTVSELLQTPANTNLILRAGVLAETLTAQSTDLRRSTAKVRAQTTVNQAVDLLSKQAAKGQPAAASAVTSVAETAVDQGNRVVAEKAVREIQRMPLPNTNLELRKQEILRRAPQFKINNL